MFRIYPNSKCSFCAHCKFVLDFKIVIFFRISDIFGFTESGFHVQLMRTKKNYVRQKASSSLAKHLQRKWITPLNEWLSGLIATCNKWIRQKCHFVVEHYTYLVVNRTIFRTRITIKHKMKTQTHVCHNRKFRAYQKFNINLNGIRNNGACRI